MRAQFTSTPATAVRAPSVTTPHGEGPARTYQHPPLTRAATCAMAMRTPTQASQVRVLTSATTLTLTRTKAACGPARRQRTSPAPTHAFSMRAPAVALAKATGACAWRLQRHTPACPSSACTLTLASVDSTPTRATVVPITRRQHLRQPGASNARIHSAYACPHISDTRAQPHFFSAR